MLACYFSCIWCWFPTVIYHLKNSLFIPEIQPNQAMSRCQLFLLFFLEYSSFFQFVHSVYETFFCFQSLNTFSIPFVREYISGSQSSSNWIDCLYLSFISIQFSSVQLLSRVRLFVTPWIVARQASLSITNSRSSLRPTSIESVMPSSHLILCRPLLLLSPIPPSMRVFSNDSALRMRWPKYWSFSFSISPSKEIPELISFRMDWLDLCAVQGTLRSLLQHHSSKSSILRHSAFFTVQLSHPYMTTGKNIALTRWTLVGKVMSLLLNILSRLVITFLLRSKHLLISWLQSPSAVILEPPKIKVWHCFYCFPIYFPWSDGTRCHDLHFLNVEL